MIKEFLYKSIDRCDIYLDVHLPDLRSRPLPILVWFHRGVLFQGSRKDVSSNMLEQVEGGHHCLISVDYRLAPQAPLSEIIEDALDALRFIRRRLAFRLDPNSVNTSDIAVSGFGAGGYLALLLALRDDQIRCCLGICPIADPLTGVFGDEPPLKARSQEAERCLDPTLQVVSNTRNNPERNYSTLPKGPSGSWPDQLHLFDTQDTESNKFIIHKALEMRLRSGKGPICPVYLLHGEDETYSNQSQSESVKTALSAIPNQEVVLELLKVESLYFEIYFASAAEKLSKMYRFLDSHWRTQKRPPLSDNDTDHADTSPISDLEVVSSNAQSEASSDESSDYDDEDDDDDADEQWAQQLHELNLLLNLVFLPLVGRYFGRQFAFWGWEKWIIWRFPASLTIVKDKGVQRATSAVLAAGMK